MYKRAAGKIQINRKHVHLKENNVRLFLHSQIANCMYPMNDFSD